MTVKSGRYLIVYAKRPLPGYAKTRLGKGIGTENAAGLYARLLYGYLIDLVYARLENTEIELSVASPDDVPFFSSAFPELRVHPQIDGDLGQRMAASFAQAFDRGAASVVLTGSDIPGLDSTLVRTAFQTLEAAPVVLGPATDGGYYLIGMRTPCASLFEGVAWSTDRTLAQTEALARAQGLEVATLSTLYDIDTRTEYERWRVARASVEAKHS
ncbi:MAG: TIGR04282 family arsenosugar biosynthesis glycosyltransferase [Anaerolineae bacterium]|nr:TIGR04282 family arsenosugar biosynthesis glycosyltransferase [Anaerolineae bacterium]